MWQGRRQSALGPIWFLVYTLAWLSECSFLVFGSLDGVLGLALGVQRATRSLAPEKRI
jgi:hypothetical protein